MLLIASGSAAMMRKADVLALGGYDATLRARGAQGCEDYKLYLSLAAWGRIVVVPDVLTGYRFTPTNMSSDMLQMERSHDIVLDELVATHPELANEVRVGRCTCLRWLLTRALRIGDWRSGWVLFSHMLVRDMAGAAAFAASAPMHALRKAGSKAWRGLKGSKPVVAPAAAFLVGSIEM